MVPPAISVIHCHLRWRDGSLWHWPLTHPTFFSEWRIMLIGTPLSATRMCLGDGDWGMKSWRRRGGKLFRVLSPPRGGRPLYSGPGSRCETSSSLCFISHVRTKTDATCGRGNLSPCCLGTQSIWLCGPSLQGWLNSGVCLFHSTSSRYIPNTKTCHSYFPFDLIPMLIIWFYAAITGKKNPKTNKQKNPLALNK